MWCIAVSIQGTGRVVLLGRMNSLECVRPLAQTPDSSKGSAPLEVVGHSLTPLNIEFE